MNAHAFRIMMLNPATSAAPYSAGVNDYETSQRYGMHGEMTARYAADRMCEFLNDMINDLEITFFVEAIYAPTITADGITHSSECRCEECETRRDNIGGIPATPHGD